MEEDGAGAVEVELIDVELDGGCVETSLLHLAAGDRASECLFRGLCCRAILRGMGYLGALSPQRSGRVEVGEGGIGLGEEGWMGAGRAGGEKAGKSCFFKH